MSGMSHARRHGHEIGLRDEAVFVSEVEWRRCCELDKATAANAARGLSHNSPSASLNDLRTLSGAGGPPYYLLDAAVHPYVSERRVNVPAPAGGAVPTPKIAVDAPSPPPRLQNMRVRALRRWTFTPIEQDVTGQWETPFAAVGTGAFPAAPAAAQQAAADAMQVGETLCPLADRRKEFTEFRQQRPRGIHTQDIAVLKQWLEQPEVGPARPDDIYIEVQRAGERYHLVLLNERGMFEYLSRLDNRALPADFEEMEDRLGTDEEELYVPDKLSCRYFWLFIILAVVMGVLWTAGGVVKGWIEKGWDEGLKNLVLLIGYEFVLATLLILFVESLPVNSRTIKEVASRSKLAVRLDDPQLVPFLTGENLEDPAVVRRLLVPALWRSEVQQRLRAEGNSLFSTAGSGRLKFGPISGAALLAAGVILTDYLLIMPARYGISVYRVYYAAGQLRTDYVLVGHDYTGAVNVAAIDNKKIS